jgi:hypothetical protein
MTDKLAAWAKRLETELTKSEHLLADALARGGNRYGYRATDGNIMDTTHLVADSLRAARDTRRDLLKKWQASHGRD